MLPKPTLIYYPDLCNLLQNFNDGLQLHNLEKIYSKQIILLQDIQMTLARVSYEVLFFQIDYAITKLLHQETEPSNTPLNEESKTQNVNMSL